MGERKPFLLRLDAAALEALQRWANDEFRSLNGQIEFLLMRALQDAGRRPDPDKRGGTAGTVSAKSRTKRST